MTSERWLRASATLTMDMAPVYILNLQMYMNTAPTGTSAGHFLGLNPVFVRTNVAQNPGRPTYSFALSWVSYWVVSPTFQTTTR